MRLGQSQKKVGMVGIGGSGMRGLAYLLSQQDLDVVGTDAKLEETKELLKDEPFKLVDEEKFKQQMSGFTEVIFSDAVDQEHRLRQAARDLKREINYQAAVGNFAKGFKRVVAVTGTHGKSSTCAMAAHIMIAAGLDPTVLIGAAMREWGGRHARMGANDILVLEADEYREHFLTLRPDLIAITSIDFDHPDFFNSLEQTEEAYSKFIRHRKQAGVVMTLKGIQQNHPTVEWPANTIVLDEQEATQVQVSTPGQHMKTNGLIAMQIAGWAGAEEQKLAGYLASYTGIKRRFERLGDWQGMEVISDYGHHPTEIARTLEAAREKYPQQRIVAIFEPHTQERLQNFLPEFLSAFRKADGVILTPIFMPRGRENTDARAGQLKTDLINGWQKDNIFIAEVKKGEAMNNVLTKAAGSFGIAIAFSAGDLDGMLRTILRPK